MCKKCHRLPSNCAVTLWWERERDSRKIHTEEWPILFLSSSSTFNHLLLLLFLLGSSLFTNLLPKLLSSIIKSDPYFFLSESKKKVWTERGGGLEWDLWNMRPSSIFTPYYTSNFPSEWECDKYTETCLYNLLAFIGHRVSYHWYVQLTGALPVNSFIRDSTDCNGNESITGVIKMSNNISQLK